jgi:prephenate dehydratase
VVVRDGARLRIAFQGERGSFSDEAIQQLFGSDAQRLPCREFADVTAAIASDVADCGVLPIENSIVGPITGARAAIAATAGLHVLAETVVAVHHCLLGLPTTTVTQVTRVVSHPVALQQCQHFFSAHRQFTVQSFYDTAGAAMHVAAVADPSLAAVASHRAAILYNLHVLRADIEDRADNETRFVALCKRAVSAVSGTQLR